MSRLASAPQDRAALSPSAMPCRQPGAAIAPPPLGAVDDSLGIHAGWPEDTLFAPLQAESLRRVLDGLRNLH
jgi:hypothetical protein